MCLWLVLAAAATGDGGRWHTVFYAGAYVKNCSVCSGDKVTVGNELYNLK